MKNLAMTTLRLLAMATTLATTLHLFGQDADENRETFGTAAYSQAPDLSTATAAVSVEPFKVEQGADYTTGGVSLRNRAAGNINMSGLTGPSRLTFLYWAVITTEGLTKVPLSQIQIQRLEPAPVSAPLLLNGVIVGSGPTPCWGPASARIFVYRAVVPAVIGGPGNGSYQVTLLPGSAGLTSGQDPWTLPVTLPLWEGASLVMIGNGIGTVSIYDVGLAGDTFAPNPNPFKYSLNLPVVPTGKRMLLDNIGADGQHGSTTSRDAVDSLSDESTTINGIPIAGPGSDYVDSDWNGSSGLPVTQLWDDTGHDITKASQLPSGAPAHTLQIEIFSPLGPADCLTPVANVVEED